MRWEGPPNRRNLIITKGDWVWEAVQEAVDRTFDLPKGCGYVDVMVEECRFSMLAEAFLLIYTGVLAMMI